MTANLAALLYLVAGVLFILALRGLSSPETSRAGQPLRHDRHGDRDRSPRSASHPPAGIGAWVLVIARHRASAAASAPSSRAGCR